MRKLLFLDFDGVLNNIQFWTENPKTYRDFDPRNVCELRYIINQLPIEIVVSSSWRIGAGLTGMRELFKTKFSIDPGCVVGVTERLGGERGHEIQKWLMDNIADYAQVAILDDDSDMGPVMPYLFKIDRERGWTPAHSMILEKWFKDNENSVWRRP